MEVKLFEDQPEVVSMLESLNQQEENQAVTAFRKVAEKMSDSNSGTWDLDSDVTEATCRTILERVAFFPAKPALLREELLRLGLRPSLGQRLSDVWAETAKKIVAERKKVSSDLRRINFEVVREVKTEEQTVNLYLHDQSDRVTLLTFTPQQLFAFYTKLESVQTSIDSICK